MNKAVAKKVQSNNAVAIMSQFENVQTGFEDMNADDLQLPRLKLLQAMSPELENDDALRAGNVFNSSAVALNAVPAKTDPFTTVEVVEPKDKSALTPSLLVCLSAMTTPLFVSGLNNDACGFVLSVAVSPIMFVESVQLGVVPDIVITPILP